MKAQNSRHQFKVLSLVAGAALLLVSMGMALAQESSLVRFSVGSGGGTVSTESLTLRGAMGQPVAGSVQNSGSNSLLCAGLQCGQGASAQPTPTPETPTPETPTSEPSETPTSEPSETPTSEPSETSTSEPTETPSSTPEPRNEDVVISEVYYGGNSPAEDWIEVHNTGSSAIDISNWWFCSLFSYETLGQMSLVHGADLMLQPGEVVVLQAWTNLDNSAADLGLYINDPGKADGRPDFNDEDFMVDYLQWGTPSGIGRSTVAARKGIWPETSPGVFDFIPTAPAGQSVALISSNGGTAASDFANGEQSPGQPNSPVGSSSTSIFLPFVTED